MELTASLDSDVLVDFTQNGVEFASRDIALYLLISLVVFPTMQPRREFGTHWH